MQEIDPIYYNKLGICFYWKRGTVKDIQKVQLVFRDSCILLSPEELHKFYDSISTLATEPPLCSDCKENDSCRSLLLETPIPQLCFAVSYKELQGISDLIRGTLFQLDLEKYLDKLCGN
ncbi:hypothetical protein [Poritiphilus flavus]|uniref:Uncharacterized protein n=1 Tax=Poritiphilus flavus TaxID=2697053 RepID=A0A6L9ECV6_9FLAO|nr:hypothetical protein [Poritiphilus flavus]NAS12451.1 hypothetical protein [Poritiphilus flavus]